MRRLTFDPDPLMWKHPPLIWVPPDLTLNLKIKVSGHGRRKLFSLPACPHSCGQAYSFMGTGPTFLEFWHILYGRPAETSSLMD